MSQGPSPMHWRTSSYSGNASGNCVEVALDTTTLSLRDTKDRQGGTQAYTASAWSAFQRHLTQP